ncbi:MAG: alpha/beta hydrolase [Clostridiales bacterium]|nr:alpha/beta hydrolase [Clostridiales bacterium]
MRLPFELLSEQDYPAQIGRVQGELAKVKTTGTFARNPGETIYYELYEQAGAKGWVAISHGFEEATVKYAEVIWYFLQAGYNVAICDHRGHGNSFRQVPELWLTHVDKFTDYCEDYRYFLQEVVLPQTAGLPCYLLGHSMGGAIAALTLELFPELPVEKLVLSSPMIAPKTQRVPFGVALFLARFFIAIGKGKDCLFNQRVFTGEEDFDGDWACATSYARYCWYLQVQREHEQYQNNAATYCWLRESLLVTKKLMQPERCANLRLPVLLLQAGQDTMVKNEAQDKFLAQLPNVRKVAFPTARHEIFRSEDATVGRFMEEILNFLEN